MIAQTFHKLCSVYKSIDPGNQSKAYNECTGGYEGRSAHVLLQAPATSFGFNNDPSAGSPTETLLRLLLPLNDQV